MSREQLDIEMDGNQAAQTIKTLAHIGHAGENEDTTGRGEGQHRAASESLEAVASSTAAKRSVSRVRGSAPGKSIDAPPGNATVVACCSAVLSVTGTNAGGGLFVVGTSFFLQR